MEVKKPELIEKQKLNNKIKIVGNAKACHH
jgi:hypothetical protein